MDNPNMFVFQGDTQSFIHGLSKDHIFAVLQIFDSLLLNMLSDYSSHEYSVGNLSPVFSENLLLKLISLFLGLECVVPKLNSSE